MKIKLCKEYLSGRKSSCQLQSEYNIYTSLILFWSKTYQKHGESAFDYNEKNKSYTKLFKLKVINYALKHTSRQSSLEFNISPSVVKSWVKKYNILKEVKDYKCYPEEEIYKMKSKPTTQEEKLEMVIYCLKHNKNYTLTAAYFTQPYSQIYNWVKKYEKFGPDELKDRRGQSSQSKNKSRKKLTDLDKVKVDLNKANRKIIELEWQNDLLKKVKELEEKAAMKKL